MLENQAVEIILSERNRAIAIGQQVWLCLLIGGILGWQIWHWMALILSLVSGICFSVLYILYVLNKIARKTHLNIAAQQQLLAEHASRSKSDLA